jgi:hypothetical protein
VPGLLAVQLGARSVCLTECDDRALEGIMNSGLFTAADAAAGHSLQHLLWEQDLEDEEVESGVDPNRTTPERIRNWSDAHRLADDFPALAPEIKYDVVVASDCLCVCTVCTISYHLRRCSCLAFVTGISLDVAGFIRVVLVVLLLLLVLVLALTFLCCGWQRGVCNFKRCMYDHQTG